jgi:sulfate permease, SulP family
VAVLFTSSAFMAVINTSAMALVVGDTLASFSGDQQVAALVMLTILVGLFQLALGLLKLGYLTRFISNAVMTGFLSGITIIIILSQLGDFTGFSGEGNNKIAQTIDLLRNLEQIDLPTLAIGFLTFVLIIVLERTRLNPVAMLVALVIATALVPLAGWDSVTLVGDTASIPRSLPLPTLPDLTLAPQLILPAIAIGIIGLVQAAGVSQGFPNPDGRIPNASGDFRGQGLANLVTGFFRGLPIGGSLSGTALVVNAGARSRLANVLPAHPLLLGSLREAHMIAEARLRPSIEEGSG